MREALATWISGTDALRRFNRFGVAQVPIALGPYQTRSDDYYLALVGELFERIREPYENRSDWARLGNAIAQYSAPERRQEVEAAGIDVGQANLYAASAFYFGGFPASAYLIMSSRPLETDDAVYRACFELLGRPQEIRSEIGNTLVNALRSGNLAAIDEIGTVLRQEVSTALRVGPSEWIPRRLLHALVARFRVTNIRAVLPDGASDFWTPLVESWLAYRPPAWDFFPSQIEAIEKGILQKPETFSLQMPTGAGKTALCETLLYWHTKRYPAQAGVLLVPYRSLASELRRSFVRRLNGMGIPTGCAYGGTVPSGDEVRGLDDINAMVATPETLSVFASSFITYMRRRALVRRRFTGSQPRATSCSNEGSRRWVAKIRLRLCHCP